MKKDKIYESLVTSDEHDGIAKTTLAVIFPALCLVSKKLFKDHLDGGKFSNVGDEMKEKCKSVPKTSKFAESVFGALDLLMRSKPNTSFVSQQSDINHGNTLLVPQSGIAAEM